MAVVGVVLVVVVVISYTAAIAVAVAIAGSGRRTASGRSTVAGVVEGSAKAVSSSRR